MFQLRLSNAKCKFCCPVVKFLGHILTSEGIAVDPGKIQAIVERKEPKNMKELISFIQTCSWYRRFIDGYAEIARPLTNLTKKAAIWKWGEEEGKAFNALKKALTTSPVLKQAVENKPFLIRTDASAYALGAVLLQGEGAEEHPIEYASRLLTKVERKNRDLKTQLAILVQTQHDRWDQSLAAIRFAMNTAKNQSTGYSAAFLTFGRELRTLDDVKHDVRQIIETENFIPEITSYLQTITRTLKNAKEMEAKTQDRNKAYVDKRRRPQPQFEIGSKVLVTTHVLSNAAKGITSKFVPKRDGPYIITKKIGSSTYEVSTPDNLNVPLGSYHASALTFYKDSNPERDPAPVQPIKRRGRPRRTK